MEFTGEPKIVIRNKKGRVEKLEKEFLGEKAIKFINDLKFGGNSDVNVKAEIISSNLRPLMISFSLNGLCFVCGSMVGIKSTEF